MKRINMKAIYPYVFAVVLFIVVSYAYFPALFEGKLVHQSDISSWKGAANELLEYRDRTGEETLWTNSMFGGMPTTMIFTKYEGNLLEYLYKPLFIGERPASYLIVALLSFYLLMLACRVNKWLAIVGAIAFGFCSYNFQILQVGHNGKMIAIAFMPMVLASLIYAFRSNRWLGAVLFGITLSFELIANHPQITFYLAMMVFAYGIGQLYAAIQAKRLPGFIKTSVLVVVATLCAAGSNVNHLWPTWEYAKYTMRGGSELTLNQQGATKGGLDKAYATNWSYGIEETPNLFIPNFNGGASTGDLGQKSETYKTLQQYGVRDAEQIVRNMPTYWGPQAFTAGPMYMGAISVFLFVLGLVLIQGPAKWWVAGISLLALLLGWGRHFMWLSSFFYDYVPLYNKFRVPSMILVTLQVTIPLLGFYCLNKIFQEEFDKKTLMKGLKIAGGITGGFCLLFVLLPGMAGSFSSPNDAMFKNFPQLLPAIVEDRQSLLRSDALRSLAYIVLSMGVIWGYIQKRLKRDTAILIVGLLVVADMWTIDKRYLNDDHFVTPREFDSSFAARPVDEEILKDRSLDYRVLDLSVSTFNDSHVSFHHKTIGGYSAAKLQRYQDLIDYHIIPEIQAFSNELQKDPSLQAAEAALARRNVLNMLNTKYVILNEHTAVENRSAFGNAWFVKDYKIVNTPDEEILTLKQINPADMAIIHKDFSDVLQNRGINFDENASIQLVHYAPNRLEYKTRAADTQLALFSEVYYPKGWRVTIDGEESGHFRANYILRGALVPAGEHTIVFEFRPESHYLGAKISRCFSGLLLLALGICLALQGKRYLLVEKD